MNKTLAMARREAFLQVRSPVLVLAGFLPLLYVFGEMQFAALSWERLGIIVANWTGLIMSLIYTFHLANSLAREQRSGFGELVYARPIAAGQYALSKALGSLTILILLAGLVALISFTGAAFLHSPGGNLIRGVAYSILLPAPSLLFITGLVAAAYLFTRNLLLAYGAGFTACLISLLGGSPASTITYLIPLYTVDYWSEFFGFGLTQLPLILNRVLVLLAGGLFLLLSTAAARHRLGLPGAGTKSVASLASILGLAGVLILGWLLLGMPTADQARQHEVQAVAQNLANIEVKTEIPWEIAQVGQWELYLTPAHRPLADNLAAALTAIEDGLKLFGMPISKAIEVPAAYFAAQETGTIPDEILLVPVGLAEISDSQKLRRSLIRVCARHLKLPSELDETTADAIYLYAQWVAVRETLGAGAVEEEVPNWQVIKDNFGVYLRDLDDLQRSKVLEKRNRAMENLEKLGAAQGSYSDKQLELALTMYELGQSRGHETLLAELISLANKRATSQLKELLDAEGREER